MDFSASQTELNILLSNTTGFAFNSDEITQILTDAWNDKYAINPLVWDDSLTFDAKTPTYSYVVPDTLTTVNGIYIRRSNNDFPTEIDKKLWYKVGSNVQFFDGTLNFIPDGTTLYLKGYYKITTDDTIDDSSLQQYVIALAGYNALRYLLFKRTMQFLKNDTSVSEIVGARKELYVDVVRWRQQIESEFVGV